MEIEILKNWVTESETFFNEKYGNKENFGAIEKNNAGMVSSFIKIWKKRLSKMEGGKIMNARIIKKINNLPALKNTKPNLLMR